MKEKEITEGNKLIAEFMGSSFKTYKKGHIRKDSVTVCYFDDGMSPFSGGVSIENLKYHSSWDWLMPVVEKIETIDFVVIIKQGECVIVNNSGNTPKFIQQVSTTKIESIWLAVCEFIEWYNETK